MKVIIADTSCLILYHKLNRLEILKSTFGSLMVTPEVSLEFGPLPSWVSIQAVSNQKLLDDLLTRLGDGEASSIALAVELDNSVLVIDEKKGRNIAKEFDLKIIGSLGILLLAKQKKVIDLVSPILEEIEATDFRLSSAVKEKLLMLAKEN